MSNLKADDFGIGVVERLIDAIDKVIEAEERMDDMLSKMNNLYERFARILLGKYYKSSYEDLKRLHVPRIPIQVTCKKHKRHYLTLESIKEGYIEYYSRISRHYYSCYYYEGYGNKAALILYIINSLPNMIKYLDDYTMKLEEYYKSLKDRFEMVYGILQPFIISEELDGKR